MAERKVIVTIAPTGGMVTKEHNPHIPTQPQEIAEDVSTGIAMCQNHSFGT